MSTDQAVSLRLRLAELHRRFNDDLKVKRRWLAAAGGGKRSVQARRPA